MTTAHEQLLALVKAEEHNEVACCRLLEHAQGLLIRDPFLTAEYPERETPGQSGRVDFLQICVTVERVGNKDVEYRKAIIWEAKAPQCPVFRMDNRNRLSPSPELYDAENQLFNYFHERHGQRVMAERYGVLRPDDFQMGGIIIGSSDRLVSTAKAGISEAAIFDLYCQAREIRNRYVYRAQGIRLLTWSDIVRFLAPAAPGSSVVAFSG